MHKSEKEAAIKQLNERFVRAKSAVLAEFSKLDVAAVTQLRKKCREGGVEYRVIKNTLAKRAAKIVVRLRKVRCYQDCLAESGCRLFITIKSSQSDAEIIVGLSGAWLD